MRYIAERIRPETGTPSPGTSNVLVREYANDRNALRFMHRHLAAPWFEAGQYRVSRWPAHTFEDGPLVGYLYKLAPSG